MSVNEIPLSPQPQTFLITLSGQQYRLTFRWNADPQLGGWFMDIQNNQGALLLGGAPLITGANILEQYDYLGIGGSIIVQTDHTTDDVPTYENLGINSHVFYLVP